MTRERVERCSGTGTVTKDGLTIGKAHYVLEVYRKVAVVHNPGTEVNAPDGGISVRIRLTAPTFARTPIALSKAVITVSLEDGRRATGVLKGNTLVLRDLVEKPAADRSSDSTIQ